MKRIVGVALWISPLWFSTLYVSCGSKNEQNTEYHYYPKSNVYYKVSEKTYLYSLDAGKSWDSLFNSSEDPPAALGEKVVLYGTPDSVWKQNETHRQQYGGVLYNLASSKDSTTALTATDVSEKKVVSKSNIPATNDAENSAVKKKRPIKKFFEKIFGKKKNK